MDTCIIPAAGKGSRWAPVSGYLPKEMLPLIDRPVIEWVIEEAINSKVKNVVIIINKNKLIIKDYLLKNRQLKDKVEIKFVFQEQPLGLAHALNLAKKFTKDKPFFVALPDLPTLSQKPTLIQLLEVFKSLETKNPIVSFDTFPPETLSSYSECLFKNIKPKIFQIVHICPRNLKKSHHPENRLRMSGRYIFTPEVMSELEELTKNKIDKEISDVDIINSLLNKAKLVLGYQIQGHTYDTGNPKSYIRANTAFFKKNLQKKMI